MANRWLGTLHYTHVLCLVKTGTQEAIAPVAINHEMLYTSIDYPDQHSAFKGAIALNDLTSQDKNSQASDIPGQVYRIFSTFKLGVTEVGANNFRN